MSEASRRQIYRMHDVDSSGMIETELQDAAAWNKKGFGIFHAIQIFDGPRRIENLKQIISIGIDIDSGSKQSQSEKIKSTVLPSLVVESDRGYHVYLDVDHFEPHLYKPLLEDRIVPYYGADIRAMDLTRVLRVPGFYHLKNPQKPFLVKTVWTHPVKYSYNNLLIAFPMSEDAKRREIEKRKFAEETGRGASGDCLWERLYNLDCKFALTKLSGHDSVSGEIFNFRLTTNGKFNIKVNNKNCEAWIDKNGRIGSRSRGGPTIYQWLKYYGHKPSHILGVIRELFPEVFANDRE